MTTPSRIVFFLLATTICAAAAAGVGYSHDLNYAGNSFVVSGDTMLANAKRSIEIGTRIEGDGLSKPQVREIATACKLFEETDYNPHLRYTEGDISF